MNTSTIISGFHQFPQANNTEEDDWIVLGANSQTEKGLPSETEAGLHAFLPQTNSDQFVKCLSRFRELTLTKEKKEGTYSKTWLVTFNNRDGEAEPPYLLRVFKTDQLDEGKTKDTYFRFHQNSFGCEWEPFLEEDGPTYGIARNKKTNEFNILSKYEIQKLKREQSDIEYELFATLSQSTRDVDPPSDAALSTETYQTLADKLPNEADRFIYCLAKRFPNLTIQKALGQGQLSNVWLATYGEGEDIALRISRTDHLPQPRNHYLGYFQIRPDHWGAEFNAFRTNDPYALETHYAIVWNGSRFVLLDKFEIQRQYENRSNETLTLYATISPFLTGSSTLTHYLETAPTPMPFDAIRNFASQLLLGLANLPDGMSHRDLKPDNVLVTSDLVLKLIDFGFSSSEEKDLHQTMVGTPLFMAPEVLSGNYDPKKADLFSLYAIIHLMLTKKHPFEATTQAELFRKHQEYVGNGIGPGELLRDQGYPENFLTFLDRIGHPDPNKRWNARKLLEEDCFLRTPGTDPLPRPPTPPPRIDLPPIQPPEPPQEISAAKKDIFLLLFLGGAAFIIHKIAKRRFRPKK